MATNVDQTSGPPPAEGRTLGSRKRLVPYALAAPGSLWLLVFFLLPGGFMVFTSLKSGGVFFGVPFALGWGS